MYMDDWMIGPELRQNPTLGIRVMIPHGMVETSTPCLDFKGQLIHYHRTRNETFTC